MKEGYIDFDEYIRQGEPDKKEKATIWQTAIGLQAVDGLKTSDYLYLRHIGFKVSNDMFALHSWYFRNALVRANYKNAVKGIDYSPIYLERFFRNLLLGEKWDLRNRYLHIHPTEDWKVQPNLAIPEQVPHKLHTDNLNIQRLVQIVGDKELSVKEIMECIGLKDRKNVLNLYLNPAIAEGYVCLLYPDKPRHPRQKYQLTMKGVTLYNELKI
ncbi:MAG: hypothetical protein UH077_02745 [Bacteroidales bacterium]|nr:hypothetical protein [Bacteroidales bacterium]